MSVTCKSRQEIHSIFYDQPQGSIDQNFQHRDCAITHRKMISTCATPSAKIYTKEFQLYFIRLYIARSKLHVKLLQQLNSSWPLVPFNQLITHGVTPAKWSDGPADRRVL